MVAGAIECEEVQEQAPHIESADRGHVLDSADMISFQTKREDAVHRKLGRDLVGLAWWLVLGAGSCALRVEAATLDVCPSGCTYSSIQAAIDAADHGDTMSVGSGTYVENIDFKAKAVAVKSLNGAAETVIDGNRAGIVVTFASDEGPTSMLVGFTVTNGSYSGYGGGVYCSHSSPTIKNCIISSNRTTNDGGGVFCAWSASPVLTNCVIIRNSAGSGGGGVYCGNSSSLKLVNCTLSRNTANTGGGIKCWGDSSATAVNCILWKDKASGAGREVFLEGSTIAISYSDIQGGWKGKRNINALPDFKGASDYHLRNGSPCIDRGTNRGAPETDIDSDPRPQGVRCDMGADEYKK